MNTTKCITIIAVLTTGSTSLRAAEPAGHGHEIEEITVTATPLKRSAQELVQPTSVLTGEALAKKQAASLGETLSEEAGVSSTYFGPVASRPVIRGQSGERVRVLQDSLDVLDVSALSEDHQVAIESIVTERVEIVRGPATLLYGSGASGGLVNVVDNRIAEAAPESPVSGAIAASADSAIDGRAIAGRVLAGNDGVALQADFARRFNGNVKIPGLAESAAMLAAEGEEGGEATGVAENTDGETDSGAAGISFFHDKGFVGVSMSRLSSNYGVPGEHGHEEETSLASRRLLAIAGAEEEFVRIDLDQRRFDLKARYDFDATIEEARLRIGRNDYTHTEFEGEEVGTVFESEGLETRIELGHRELRGWTGAFGFQRKHVDLDAIGEEAFIPRSETTQNAVFMFEERLLGEATVLQGGARIEHQSLMVDGAGEDYSRTAFSGSLGALHSLTENLTITANLSLTERHPNPTELFADGPHVALSRFERGASAQGLPAFDKEQTTNLDVSFNGETERLRWSLTGFYSDIRDYIFAAPDGTEEDGFPVFNFRQTDAEFYGFEAEGRVELYDGDQGHVHAHVFSDFVYGEENGSGPYLPRLPPLRYGFGLHFDGGNMAASVRVIRHERQDKIAAGELPTDAYALVNADVDYHFSGHDLWLFLKGTNLTDEEARQHTSPVKDLLPLPGRGFHAGLRYEF